MKLRALIESIALATLDIEPRQALELQRAFSLSGAYAEFQAKHLGRGGGPDATPFTVTLIALAAWSDKPRSTEAWSYAQQLFETPTKGSDVGQDVSVIVGDEQPDAPLLCEITDEPCLGKAVSAILANPALAAQIRRIVLRRDIRDAMIEAKDGRQTRFVSDTDLRRIRDPHSPSLMRVDAVITGEALCLIAGHLAQ